MPTAIELGRRRRVDVVGPAVVTEAVDASSPVLREFDPVPASRWRARGTSRASARDTGSASRSYPLPRDRLEQPCARARIRRVRPMREVERGRRIANRAAGLAMTTAPTIPLELPEVACASPLLVIADLHLDLADERGGREFALWLASLRGVGALAILGDLFDAWVGPAQERLPGADEALDALASLARAGTELLVVHGNRDFLLDRSFERRTGARVLRDGFTTRLADGSRAAFVHGDTLCTKDLAYQRLRRVVRSKPVTWLAPRLPLFVGTAIARRLRRASIGAVARKPTEEKSIQRDAAATLAREAGADLLVCGHVHAFRDETLDGRARWIVLDAFGGERDALVLSDRAVVALAARDLARRDCASIAVP